MSILNTYFWEDTIISSEYFIVFGPWGHLAVSGVQNFYSHPVSSQRYIGLGQLCSEVTVPACHAWGVTGQKAPSLSLSRKHTLRNRISAQSKAPTESHRAAGTRYASHTLSPPSPRTWPCWPPPGPHLSLKPGQVGENSQKSGAGLRDSNESNLAKSQSHCCYLEWGAEGTDIQRKVPPYGQTKPGPRLPGGSLARRRILVTAIPGGSPFLAGQHDSSQEVLLGEEDGGPGARGVWAVLGRRGWGHLVDGEGAVLGRGRVAAAVTGNTSGSRWCVQRFSGTSVQHSVKPLRGNAWHSLHDSWRLLVLSWKGRARPGIRKAQLFPRSISPSGDSSRRARFLGEESQRGLGTTAWGAGCPEVTCTEGVCAAWSSFGEYAGLPWFPKGLFAGLVQEADLDRTCPRRPAKSASPPPKPLVSSCFFLPQGLFIHSTMLIEGMFRPPQSAGSWSKCTNNPRARQTWLLPSEKRRGPS